MQHRMFAPVALTAVLLAAGLSSEALAADPSGIWAKEDGSAKMEVTKCGRGLCSKIVWLQNPNDSRGRPLHDARNENASMRDRPIMGLPIFKLASAGPNVWVGPVYNPEEGRIYNDVKVTLVSSRQLVLRGCKAMLFCGEKIWTRSQLPPSELPQAEEEIEAKAPGGTEATRVEAASAGESQYIAPGVVATPTKTEPLPLSGEDVPSMMVVNKPAPGLAGRAPSNNQAAIEAAATEAAPPLPVRAPDASAQPQVAAKPIAEKPQVTAEKPKPAHVANQSTAASTEAKPKAPVRQVQQEPRERLPWERSQGSTPSYLGFQQDRVPPAGPIRSLFGGLFR